MAYETKMIVTLLGIIAAVILVAAMTSLWSGLNWAPYEAEIQKKRLDVQIACIQNGGVYASNTCAWSRKE